MPWREVSVMDQRREFVMLAKQEGVNRRQLCRQFGISAQTGYKWIQRYEAGDREMANRSRRPHRMPDRTPAAVEKQIVTLRDEHPAWGARKLAHYLGRRGKTVPAISTVHQILRRHDRVTEPPGPPGKPYTRFERPHPNELWQMDFKGHSPLENGTSCHPLTMVDDHSRFALCLAACGNEEGSTVRGHLTTTFRRYGLPDAMFVDNGGPWGFTLEDPWTRLTVWLLKYGVRVIHSRPYHPQSRGKNERFHRTLKAELFKLRRYRDLRDLQRAFDRWRSVYNLDRPHEALNYEVPASRYRPSPRMMPSRLPIVQYDSNETVRSVSSTKAYISFQGRLWKVPQAFCGERLAIRPTANDGEFGVFFAAHQIAAIDLRNP